MFWDEFQDTITKEKSIQEFIDENDFEQVLDHPLLYEQLRVGDQKLTDYLTRKDVMSKMLDMALSSANDENSDPVSQYKNANLAVSILSLGNLEISNGLMKRDNLKRIKDFLRPSESENMNSITSGFFKKIVTCLAGCPDNWLSFIDELMDSSFLDDVINNLKYGAMADLLVRLPVTRVYSEFQKKIFQWYSSQDLPRKLISLINPETHESVIENVVFIFQEFNAMLIITIDPAKDFCKDIFSIENTETLLNKAFPRDESKLHIHVTNSCCQLLEIFTDINHSTDEPAYKVNPWLYLRPPPDEIFDETFIVENLIAERSSDIVRVLLWACNHSDPETYLPISVSCITLLQSLINTTNFATHCELRHTFLQQDTSWKKLIAEISHRPLFSVFNSRVVAFFAYIIYGFTGEGFPLMDLLFQPGNSLLDIVVSKNIQAKNEEEMGPSERADKAYFFELANYINECQYSKTPWGCYLNYIITESDSNESWRDLSTTTLKSYCDGNTSFATVPNSVNSTLEREVVVDELEFDEDSDEKIVRSSLDMIVNSVDDNAEINIEELCASFAQKLGNKEDIS